MEIYNEALHCIKMMFGDNAQFKEDQYEAIEAILLKKRLLVVEKTGWGKSIVYFVVTKLLRNNGMGPTILISPLISLMRNQIENATKLGLIALTINSQAKEEKESVLKKLRDDSCDILLISPERLANKDDMEFIINNITKGIGMFVVDEAHCISDWGHDFRPDYRRIVSIVKSMPSNVPVLATTATANRRVIDDIVEQLGNINVLSGSLMRESLEIQIIKLGDQAERLAWLVENIPTMHGSGIVYCLTINDTRKVAKWLSENGISAVAYSSDNKDRDLIEEDFMNNKMKCLVATVALGMGYDKPDIGFVIHYQRPGNIVSYYQQIGRAGRQIDKAYAILLTGFEDDDIQEYFIERAFPTQAEMNSIVELLESANRGMKRSEILGCLNMSDGRFKNCIKYMEVEGIIENVGLLYYRTIKPWVTDDERSRRITQRRYEELQEIKDYVDTTECYMEFLALRLDDKKSHKCGKCTNCTGKKYFPEDVKDSDVINAQMYLRKYHSTIEPRKKYPYGKNIPKELLLESGFTLCDYGDSGWGKFVAIDKYTTGFVRDEIIDASADLIRKWLGENLKKITITCVPSNRQPEFVKNFSIKLAKKLNIKFVDAIKKFDTGKHQKELNNSAFQYENVMNGFNVEDPVEGDILLVDDMVDSRWTLTVCGMKLKEKGALKVYPFAIASTAEKKGRKNGN